MMPGGGLQDFWVQKLLWIESFEVTLKNFGFVWCTYYIPVYLFWRNGYFHLPLTKFMLYMNTLFHLDREAPRLLIKNTLWIHCCKIVPLINWVAILVTCISLYILRWPLKLYLNMLYMTSLTSKNWNEIGKLRSKSAPIQSQSKSKTKPNHN